MLERYFHVQLPSCIELPVPLGCDDPEVQLPEVSWYAARGAPGFQEWVDGLQPGPAFTRVWPAWYAGSLAPPYVWFGSQPGALWIWETTVEPEGCGAGAGAEPTETEALAVAPEQLTEYVVLLVGETVTEPLVPLAVKWVPVQELALVEDQVRVTD